MSIFDDLAGFGGEIFGVSPAAVEEVVGIAQTALPLLRSAADDFQKIINIPGQIGEIAADQRIIIDNTTNIMGDLGRLRGEVENGFSQLKKSLDDFDQHLTNVEKNILQAFWDAEIKEMIDGGHKALANVQAEIVVYHSALQLWQDDKVSIPNFSQHQKSISKSVVEFFGKEPEDSSYATLFPNIPSILVTEYHLARITKLPSITWRGQLDRYKAFCNNALDNNRAGSYQALLSATQTVYTAWFEQLRLTEPNMPTSFGAQADIDVARRNWLTAFGQLRTQIDLYVSRITDVGRLKDWCS